MNNQIIIQDWAGNILFEGYYHESDVDKVLEANRCYKCEGNTNIKRDDCETCDSTGYWGDFEVYWKDPSRRDNVFEFINY